MIFIANHFIYLSIILFNTSIFENTTSTTPADFRNYVCYTTNEEILIDGKLSENAWKKATFSDLFVDIEGEGLPKPLHDTRVKMLWDAEYLYIGAWLEEPHIWATYTERESVIFQENDFEIFIDPNGNTHNYYEIEVNALNTIWDLLLTKPYRDGGKAINSWNVEGMKTAVYLDGTINNPSDQDKFWSVEFALPWSSLKEQAFENRKPKDGEQWRINFSRVQWRLDIENNNYVKRINPKTKKSFPEFNWVWSPQGVIAMHQPETWGFIQFSNEFVGGKKAAFVLDDEEDCKWELRKVYYAQEKFKSKNDSYADNLESLDIQINCCDNPSLEIIAQNAGFKAILNCDNSGEKWSIRQDGLIWKK